MSALKALARTRIIGLAVPGPGRHRTRPAAERKPLFPPAPPTGVVAQGFRHCTGCGSDTVAVLHRDGHTCTDCGHVHYTEDGTE